METLKKYKSLLLCFVSLLFMAGMCEEDPEVDVVLVKKITLDYTQKVLKIGETFTLAADVAPENASNSSLDWKSSNEAVATVKAGKVVAIAEGQTVITATAKDGSGVNASCIVTVIDPKVLVDNVTLDRKQAELKVGETLSLNAVVLPENADNKKLVWASDNEEIAKVEQDGSVIAVSEGVAIITATATDGSGKGAYCLVIITADQPENPNDPENPENPNDPENPEDPNNPENPNDPNEPESVLVEKISLSKSEVSLQVGETITLEATVLPDNADNKSLQWSSSKPSVATIENGVVTAVGAGAALITAKATDGSGVQEFCVVMVTDKPEPNPENPNNPDTPENPSEPDPNVVLVTKITLNKEAATLNVGGELSLTASVYPSDATEKSLTWTSSNENVATVQDGWVTAKALGQAVIKATAKDGSGVSASCVVTVSDGGVLSPVAAKNKMESAGITFVNAIKANTHQNLVDLMDYATVAFEDFEFDKAYLEKLENLVEESGYDEDYARGVNPVRAMMNMTGLCLNMAKSGAQLSTRAADVYTLTVKAGLNDLYGKFTPDYENEVWKWNSSVKDRVEVAFTDGDGQQWVATLKGSSTTTRLKITVRDQYKFGEEYIGGPYDEEYSWSDGGESRLNYTIDVPKEITFIVKCGGTNVVDLTINSSLAFEMNLNMESEYTDYFRWDEGYVYYDYENYESIYAFDVNYSNLNMDAKMTVNGYEETFKTDITKSGITASAGIKIDGRSMLSASACINADMDELIADACEEEFKARNIENFSMKFDVLGEVQIDADCPNFKNLYDAAMCFEDADGIDEANQWLDEVNGAYTAKLRFDNTAVTQATFELEAIEENDEWDSYIYTYPVMVFASNNSRYSLDEYFTETAFSDLIDAVERLAEQFEDLYGDY